MRTRGDRLRTTATIALLAVALAAVVFGAGSVFPGTLYSNVAIAVVVFGAIFASTYLFFASWADETAGLESDRSPVSRNTAGASVDPEASADDAESDDVGPLEDLKRRYADGDLSEEEFERELETTLESDTSE